MSAPDEVSERVKAILVQKDAAGEYVYTKLEVRDFIIACVFEMDLKVTPDLEGAVNSFFADLGLKDSKKEPDPEEVVDAVRAYFEKNPLNPTMMEEFTGWGRNTLLSQDEGYQKTAEALAAVRATGADTSVRAPRAEEKKPDVKLKRGLS